jgi:predicted RNA methylase
VATAAGFEHVVRRALEVDVPRARVTQVESGSIVLKGDGTVGRSLAGLPYLAVVLLELARVDQAVFDRAIVELARTLRERPVPPSLRGGGTFRIRTSDGGRLVRVDPGARKTLESAVAEWSGARLDARGGGSELWVLRRAGDQHVSVAARLDRRRVARPEPGALKPDVAAALVRAVPPHHDDVVLDAFAGSGALARERARMPYGQLFATDVDPALAGRLARSASEGALGPRATTAQLDVRDRDSLIDLLHGARVDVVLADPPWGLFAKPSGGVDTLYDAAFATFRHVLATGGRVVLLTAAVLSAESAMGDNGFAVQESFPVLVNGKKARVFVAAVPDARLRRCERVEQPRLEAHPEVRVVAVAPHHNLPPLLDALPSAVDGGKANRADRIGRGRPHDPLRPRGTRP